LRVARFEVNQCEEEGLADAESGQAFGSGLFMQGSGTITFQPGAGQTQTISDTIADEAGVVAGGGRAGTAGLGRAT
jgi:hypothetical protein